MRLKLLSIFLAIQVVSFTLWVTFFSDSAAQNDGVEKGAQVYAHSALEMASAALVQAPVSVKIIKVPEFSLKQEKPVIGGQISAQVTPQENIYTPEFSAKNMTPEEELINPIHQNQLRQVMSRLPEEHVKALKTISLDYDSQAHRGLGGGSMIILRAVDMAPEELIAVFVHEMGHNVDYAYLKPALEEKVSSFLDGEMQLYETDPSLEFYRLSWFSNTMQKPDLSTADFVSGYAMTDPFEDFGETYAFYLLHNQDFKALALNSPILQAKYDFMKVRVFNGEEFDAGDLTPTLNERPWDVTVLPYDLNRFIGTSSSSSPVRPGHPGGQGGEQNKEASPGPSKGGGNI